MSINIGCQTYTWQMSYDKYKDELSHILGVIEKAGFQGVEAEACMMGAFYQDAARFKVELQRRNLELAALTLALHWRESKETEEEGAEADRLLDYLKHFPQTVLVLVQLPGKDRSNLAERRRNCLNCANTVAQRANERGIVSALHPNSPSGSVFRTAEDYKVMFDGMDSRYLGYCPDSGHIANGGMDVMEVFKASREIIRHVHFKDISCSKEWKAMGEGVIDHPGVVRLLRDTNYKGWIMVEEESAEAEAQPDKVTLKNGKYSRRFLDQNRGEII